MNNESTIRKVLFNEVSLLLSITGVIIGAVLWISNPQQENKIEIVKLQTQLENSKTVASELEKIRNNDLNELQLRMDRIETRQIDELKAISRIEALLK